MKWSFQERKSLANVSVEATENLLSAAAGGMVGGFKGKNKTIT